MNHHSYDVPQLLSLFVEKGNNGFAVYNDENRLIYCNQNYSQQLFQLESNSAIGLTFSELINSAYKTQGGMRIDTENIEQWVVDSSQKRWKKKSRSYQISLINERNLLINEQVFNSNLLFVLTIDISPPKSINTLINQDDSPSAKTLSTPGRFIDYSYKEIQKALRNKSQLLLYQFAIDDFDQLIQKYGSLAGDMILRTLVKLVQADLREYDLVAKINNERFAILLTDTKEPGALSTIRRIQEKIGKSKFYYDCQHLSITISLGGTQLRVNDKFDQMVSRAENNLNISRKSTINNIIFSP